jgi:hypothetical protein
MSASAAASSPNILTMSDLSDFADYWLQDDCGPDLDGDCTITVCESFAFSENLLGG